MEFKYENNISLLTMYAPHLDVGLHVVVNADGCQCASVKT